MKRPAISLSCWNFFSISQKRLNQILKRVQDDNYGLWINEKINEKMLTKERIWANKHNS